MRLARCGMAVGLCVLLVAVLSGSAAGAEEDGEALEALRQEVLVYVPLEEGVRGFCGDGSAFRVGFSRRGHAYLPDFTRVEAGEPRLLEGRFGDGLLLESGHYGYYRRGQRNDLPAATAAAEGKGRVVMALGGADVEKVVDDGGALQGEGFVRVSCGAVGEGFRTPAVRPKSLMRMVGSAYLRGEAGTRVQVRLRYPEARDEEKERVGEPVEVELNGRWQFAECLWYAGWRPQAKGEVPEEGGVYLEVTSREEGDAVFDVDAMMVQPGTGFYSYRKCAGTWIDGGKHRWSESLSFPVDPRHIRPERGAVSLWARAMFGNIAHALFCVNQGWDKYVELTLSGGRLSARVADGRGRARTDVGIGEWHHYVMNWDAETAKVYVDGEKVMEFRPKQVGEGKYAPEKFYDQRFAVRLGNWDTGSGKVAVNGMVDECAIFSRPLSGSEVRMLAGREEPLPFGADVAVRFASAAHARGRDLERAAYRVELTNVSESDLTGVEVRTDIAGLFDSTSRKERLAPGEVWTVEQPFSPARLLPGEYELTARVSSEQGTEVATSFPVYVGPYKNRDALPVWTWCYGGDRELYRTLADYGVTVAYGPSGLLSDRCVREGMFSQARVRTYGSPRDGVDADRAVHVWGGVDGPSPHSEHIRRDCERAGVEAGRRYAEIPGMRVVLVNSEREITMDFSDGVAERVRREFGMDLKKWMGPKKEAWWRLRPGNILSTKFAEEYVPEDGVVASDNAFYRYHRWWNEKRGSAAGLDDLIAKGVESVCPDKLTVHDPILRAASCYRYEHTDVAQEWFYYPHARSGIRVQEALAAYRRSRGMQVTGMPQFLFKPGMVAPFGALPNPDLFREAVWHCLARPLRMLTFWNFKGALFQGDQWTPGEVREFCGDLNWKQVREKMKKEGKQPHLWQPGTREEFRRMAREVWQPLGGLFVRWENRQRSVLVVDSLAGHIFSGVRWQVHLVGPMMGRLEKSGVPFDTVYDEDFERTADLLSAYDVVVLPGCAALTEAEARQIRAFAEQGGVVVADKHLGVDIPGARVFEDEELDEVPAFIRDKAGYPVQVSSDDVMLNALEAGGASYIVAVNDRREFGPLWGRFGRSREKGIAQKVTCTYPAKWGRYAYDLLDSRGVPVEVTGERAEVVLDLPACGGRVLCVQRKPLAGVDLKLSTTAVRPGEHLEVTARLASEDGSAAAGLVPCRVEVRRPDGKVSDLSRYGVFSEGKLSLRLPVAHNAPAGEYAVRVREMAGGGVEIVRFRVEGRP